MSKLENINKSNMKDFMANDKKVVNRIKDCIVSFFTKQKIMKIGDNRYKGTFDEQGNFVEGEIYIENSSKRTGKFHTVISNGIKYDVLKEGKREYNSGLVEVGKFDDGEVLLEGERCEPNGMIYRGHFDVNTGKLYHGEVIYPDGKIEKVENKIKG